MATAQKVLVAGVAFSFAGLITTTNRQYQTSGAAPGGTDKILLESGDYILLETGDKILKE